MMDFLRGNVTKIIRNAEDNEAEQRFEKFLEKYPIIKETIYMHKREQLYLMVYQGCSDQFIDNFFSIDSNISSADLDFIRAVSVLTSEEFVMEHFYKREFSIEQGRELLAEYLVNDRFEKLPSVEQLLQENKQLMQRFDLQMDFWQREREQTKTYCEEILKSEREKNAAEKDMLQMKHQKELDHLKNKLTSLEEENTILKCVPEKERRKEEGKPHYFFRRKRNLKKQTRKEMEKDDFIVSVLSNPAFKPGQLVVIMRAVEEGLPLEALKEICVPDLSAKGMETLERFYLNK